jgi:hydroxyacylglutathione hydrolase
MFNEALQFSAEDEFVEYILTDQPEAPPYFAIMKHVNKHGPKVLGDAGIPPKLGVTKLLDTIKANMVVDVNASKNYGQKHVPRTINIPSNSIARDGGWFIDYEQPLYLIAGSAMLEETLRVLREIGVDNIAGYFDTDEVAKADLATETYDCKTASEVAALVENEEVYLIDVRRQAEWDEGHIPQAAYSFLGNLRREVSKLHTDKPIVFQCRSGARSAVACSIAQATGIKNVSNLTGGIIEWERNGYPVQVGAKTTG